MVISEIEIIVVENVDWVRAHSLNLLLKMPVPKCIIYKYILLYC